MYRACGAAVDGGVRRACVARAGGHVERANNTADDRWCMAVQRKMSPVHASENGAEVCPGGRFEVRFRVRGFAHETPEAPVTPALVTMPQGLRDSTQ